MDSRAGSGDMSIDRVRDELARMPDGPARLASLLELGRELLAEYNRVGPARPQAKPYLDEAIDTFDKAYAILQPGDAARGHVAAMLGLALAGRFGTHGGSQRDCDTGIHVLEEALSFPSLVPTHRAMARI